MSEFAEKLKREQRLSMNRASARERRKKKRLHIEYLQNEVGALERTNDSLKQDNENLKQQVQLLSEAIRSQNNLISSPLLGPLQQQSVASQLRALEVAQRRKATLNQIQSAGLASVAHDQALLQFMRVEDPIRSVFPVPQHSIPPHLQIPRVFDRFPIQDPGSQHVLHAAIVQQLPDTTNSLNIPLKTDESEEKSTRKDEPC